MAPRILILSRPTDAHAFAVAEALRRKGAEAVLWHTTDFPSRSRESVRFDGRRAHGEVRVEACEADPALVAACRALMRRLGIVFACFDFIVTPDGRPVFLEANSTGQFLWVEQRTGAPLLDAFCEMLIQGRADFDWDPARVGVRLSEVDISAAGREAQERHVVPSVEFPRETAAG